MLSHIETDYTEELYYDAQKHCMYVRCYGIQFSFHNIIVTEKIHAFANSPLNIPVECDGNRLQPISKELFLLAKDTYFGNIEVEQINELFRCIVKDI